MVCYSEPVVLEWYTVTVIASVFNINVLLENLTWLSYVAVSFYAHRPVGRCTLQGDIEISLRNHASGDQPSLTLFCEFFYAHDTLDTLNTLNQHVRPSGDDRFDLCMVLKETTDRKINRRELQDMVIVINGRTVSLHSHQF